MTPRFPWARLMQLGLGELKLSPAEFWQATPREIAAAFGAVLPVLRSEDLAAMMARYPDGGT